MQAESKIEKGTRDERGTRSKTQTAKESHVAKGGGGHIGTESEAALAIDSDTAMCNVQLKSKMKDKNMHENQQK